MKTVLIYHKGDELTEVGFSRWLSSFTDLAGVIVIEEDGSRAKQRVKAEIKRSGLLRFILDVLPYRIYSKIAHSKKDEQWIKQKNDFLIQAYPDLPDTVERLITNSPNSSETIDFITRLAPEMMLARCKTLIKKEVYSVPKDGTLILHPGICPEYRNAHGCFWAIANNELDKVGATLLKINDGVDTGPIFSFYTYQFDAYTETPAIIHARVVYDNLNKIQAKLLEIHSNNAEAIDISSRKPGIWGQPWMSKYLKYKFLAWKTKLEKS